MNESAQRELPLPPGVVLNSDETLDGISQGEILLIQRRKGYRFSIDALLLADFAGCPRGKVVELGSGCGVVGLILAAKGASSIVGVELQHSLSELALRNVVLNRKEAQVRIIQADLRELRGVLEPGIFDLVVSNPPYIPVGAGYINPDHERAIARHEVACSPEDLVSAARYLLREGGNLKVIFPAGRFLELVGALSLAGLAPRRVRFVHSLPNRPAKMVLLESTKGAGTTFEVMPPLYLFDETGSPKQHFSPIAE